MTQFSYKSGFTLIELIIVMTITIMLIGIATVSLTSIQNKTYLGTTVDSLISDLKQQQLKAMTGNTEGRATSDSYGIHFNSNSYVLFHGTTYSSSDLTNFTVPLNGGLTFSSITLPGSNLIFSQISGEVSGYSSGADTFTLKNGTINQQKTIRINRYGTIIQIN
jgi:Tfp pilus assembly protein FimT